MPGRAVNLLAERGIAARVVSMPSWDLFEAAADEYQDRVLPVEVPVLAVEAASSFGWDRYADATVSIDTYGASGDGGDVFAHFGFTADHVADEAIALLGSLAVANGEARPIGKESDVTRLHDLFDQQGQSPWIDNLQRSYLQRWNPRSSCGGRRSGCDLEPDDLPEGDKRVLRL